MRADRLITILLLLQNNGKMTSSQLASELEVSERTIFRDMEALSAAGIPVFSERGSNGGWSLTEGYRTNLTGMKSGEITSLLISNPAKVLDDLGIQEQYQAAIQKLLAAAPQSLQQDVDGFRQKLHIDGAGWHQSTESFPLLTTVQEAVWKEHKLRIHYQRDETMVERIVSPLGLVAKGSIWYMIAEVEADFRTYRISRLVEAVILDEYVKRPADFNLARYWEQSTQHFKMNLPRYPAKLSINAKVLSRLEQERYTRVMNTESIDGSTIAEVEFETLESACEIVLSFGPFLEVLEPMELRFKVIETAQAIVAVYSEK